MATITNLSEPLSDEELDRLDEILLDRVDEDAVTDGMDEGILNVSELDGLLTAVVSGPVTIMPSRWLPVVWGDFEPTWERVEDFEAFMSMAVRHMNCIAAWLIHEPEGFEPMFLERAWKGETIAIVDEWCEGYMRGVRLALDQWSVGTPEIADLLDPIRAFTEETGWLAHELPEVGMKKLRNSITPNARAIHAYWLERRGESLRGEVATARRSEPSVGRNAPCPCGSGKKYKKCCLQ
jgi:uncharacterized protein